MTVTAAPPAAPVKQSPLLHPDEALELVLRHAPAPRHQALPLDRASGLTLAAPALADRDAPPFDRVMMDGYGVRLADAGRAVVIVGEAAPGAPWRGILQPGQAVAVMTGAPAPAGVEGVVPVEDARREHDSIVLPGRISAGQHIAPRGSEARGGDVALPAGAPLTPLAIAALAAVGVAFPLVCIPPSVAIITTGNELVGAGDTPSDCQIRDSNRPMLAAMLRALGVGEITLDHAADRPEALVEALARCAGHEIVILTGGVSAGRYDHVPAAARASRWEIVFHKVAQKPGKPLLFAAAPGRLLFGLPGNPLAAPLGMPRYVAPAIRAMMGMPALPIRQRATAGAAFENRGGRILFSLVRASLLGRAWRIDSLPCRGSADILGAAAANALIRLEPGQRIDPGQSLGFEWLTGAGPAECGR